MIKNWNHEYLSKTGRWLEKSPGQKDLLGQQNYEASTKPVHHGKLPNRSICRTPSFGFGSAGRDGAVASWVTNWGCDPIRGNFGGKKLHLNNFQTPTVWVDSAVFLVVLSERRLPKSQNHLCSKLDCCCFVLRSLLMGSLRVWKLGCWVFAHAIFFEYTKTDAVRWFRHLADDSTVNRTRDIYAWFHHIKWIATAEFLNHQEHHGENPWLFASRHTFFYVGFNFFVEFSPRFSGEMINHQTEIRTQQLKHHPSILNRVMLWEPPKHRGKMLHNEATKKMVPSSTYGTKS